MTKIKKTDYARKVEDTGRVIIPAKLRTALGIEPGDILDYYILSEDGKTYLCMDCTMAVSRAQQLLDELRG